ncbi:MAG TPA: GntR family transcriptional regulator [Thermoleophilaceae bacterium]|nr:GntR family transcriptional regulator [Thermoleophilaceae bacterium]
MSDELTEYEDGLPPLIAIPLRDQVLRRLRSAILAGDIAAGERISVPDTARRLGVSATPIRDALRSLEDEGLVETAPRRWTRVAVPDSKLAVEIYPIIAALEEFAIHALASVDDELLATLEEANRNFRQAGQNGDVAACIRANDAFHGALLRATANGTLQRIVSDLKTRVRLLDSEFFRLDTDRSGEEHQNAIEALREDDLDRAGSIIHEQWMRNLPMWSERAATEPKRASSENDAA